MPCSRLILLISISLLFFACHKHSTKTAEEIRYTGKDLIVDAYVQKEVAGNPEDSSYYYLHLRLKDTLPERVDLRGITFMWQYFTLNPYQTIYKFKLKAPDDGLHQKAVLRYVNKSEEVKVVKSKKVIIAVPQKEDLYLP